MRTLYWTLLTFLCLPYLWARVRRGALPKKFLIIQLGKLGDMIATTPLIRAIKAANKDNEVHVVCETRGSLAITGSPDVSAIYYYDKTSRWELIKQLRSAKLDCSINVMPGALASVLGLWALVPKRINTPSTKHGVLVWLLGLLTSTGQPYQLGSHTYDHYMTLAKAAGIAPVPYVLNYYPQNTDNIPNLQPGYIILSLTAGNDVKEWPLEKFTQLTNYITEKLGRDVVLSTLDSVAVETVRRQVSKPVKVYDGSGVSLDVLANTCRNAAAFVAVDTGPMYLAYAMGCPVVIMVGPVHPKEQMPPESSTVAHVLPPEGCSPWVHISLTPRVGTQKQLRCSCDTTVESVIAGLHKVLH